MPSVLSRYNPPQTALSVLYQDDDLLVLDKPSGLLSVPGKSAEHADSLETRAKTTYEDALLVHRLDMETSGVFIMARTKNAQRHLGLQFEHRNAKKTYIARIAGHLEQDEGHVDLPLICDWPNRPRQMVDHKNGKKALTRWQVMVREEKTPSSMAVTRVRLLPETGRSHQLRVHMLAIGHPILGDQLYASPSVLAAAGRLQLHAQSLTILHPTSKEFLTFSAHVPF